MRKIKIFGWLLALTLFCAAMAIPALADGEQSNRITAVTIQKKLTEVEIRAELSEAYSNERKEGTVYLFGFLPYQSVMNINSMEPLASAKVADNVRFRVPFDPADVLQVHTKYAVAEKAADGSYVIITEAHYIDNPEAVAKRDFAYPKAASKKGLHVQQLNDAQELNVSHTVINIAVNEYVLTSGGSNAQAYVYDNKTFYVSKEKLVLLDQRVKVLTEAGVNIYFNILLTSPDNATSSDLACLYAAEKSPEAGMYALNTRDRDGVMYYQSFLSFLAERYTREDGLYGFAGSFIVGYQVNSNRNWNYMGPQTVSSYLNSYIVNLRIADTALRSVYANGRVYVSVGNNFNVMANDTGAEPDSSLDYAAKDLLVLLNAMLKNGGDIPWNVAVTPYYSAKGSAAFWQDDSSYADYTTPYITMKNIGTLTAFLSQEDFDWHGLDRKVLISYGVDSGEDESGERLQAAAYAYAYYLAEADEGIEAIIYYRHIDHAGENGLKYGLWKSDAELLLTPSSKKYIYDVFRYIDTDRGPELTAFAPSYIGAVSWTELLPKGFVPSDAARKTVIDAIAIGVDEIPGGYQKKIRYNFSTGSFDGFYPTDNAEYIELREMHIPETTEDGIVLTETEGETQVKLYAKLVTLERFGYMGVGNYFDVPFALPKNGYASVEVKVDAPESVTSITVLLRLYKNGGEQVVYNGITQIAPNNWETLGFKLSTLSEVIGEIDGMKILVKPYDDQTYSGDFGLWVGEIALYEKSGNAVAVFLWVLLGIVIAAVVAVVLFIAVRYYLYQRHRKNLQAKRQALRNRQTAQPEQYRYHPTRSADRPRHPTSHINRSRGERYGERRDGNRGDPEG